MNNFKIFGNHDAKTVEQMARCMDFHAEKGVLCADGHLGYSQPVGGVIAYKEKVSISGVGYDISCGNLAIKTNADAADVQKNINTIMDDIVKNISFGVGGRNKIVKDHKLFESEVWQMGEVHPLQMLAAAQLGTVGSGNHYVDIFIDENNSVWVGVHFGSRGLGHNIAKTFLNLAGGKDGIDNLPTLVDVNSDLGQRYLKAIDLAGQYAYAGREFVARYVTHSILQAGIVEEVHNHHNFAWQEVHGNEIYWVVRKGATPCFPEQKGFIGGSMGDNAVIIEGVDSDLSKEALYSTVHGAGRVMSRTQAKGKWKKGEQVSQGLVTRQAMDEWIKGKGVCVRGGDVDESPQAYRRLDEVLKFHEGTIKVLHTLRPIGVAMAGNKDFDPYKD